MPKVIIFDFDGVIADTFNLHLELSQYFQPQTTAEVLIEHTMGNPLLEPKIKFKKEELPPYFDMYTEKIKKEDYFPVVNAIKNLSKKYTLVICSGSPEKGIRKFLKFWDIENCFAGVYDVYTSHNKIEKFGMIFKDHKVNVDECIYVTDTVGDIKEAKAINIKTIAVTWGFHSKMILLAAKPYAVIDRIEDLEKHLF